MRVQFFRLFLVSAAAVNSAVCDDQLDRIEAGMRSATGFFAEQVSSHGGYLWRYSADLTKREGEERASEQTVWVQPPGTPSVGQIFLDAHQATGDRFYLEAAVRAGQCLVRGQLRSGGWDYRIEFDPRLRKNYAYRVDPEISNARNTTTLDDNTTQAALRFLMRLDERLSFKNETIHQSVVDGLQTLLDVQYPHGAWPQRFEQPPATDSVAIKKASYPDSWSRTYPGKNYRGYFTFNDNATADTIDTLLLAATIYGQQRYRQAATRAGEFILLARMPEPQPAWAQQYNLELQPAWARKFEPPAITGGESQGVMRTLLQLYRETGERRFIEPIPRAIEYLKSSQLDGGGLARFYELKTNRPLYFTRQYELTYRDDDLPTHYGFKVDSKLQSIQNEYDRLIPLSTSELAALRRREQPPKLSQSLGSRALSIVGQLDDKGRWVETGRLSTFDGGEAEPVIESQTFIRNMSVLVQYSRAAKAE